MTNQNPQARYDHEPAGLPPGFRAQPTRYAWYGPTEKLWLVVCGDDLACFLPQKGTHLTDPVGVHLNAYTSWVWNLGSRAARMKPWWTPEHRYAYRDKRDGTIVRESSLPNPPPLGPQWERITIDLETGEKVEA